MTLDEFIALLDVTPVIADIHPVSLCYLPSDVVIAESSAEVAWQLDDPRTILPQRMVMLDADPLYRARFPGAHCDHDPFTHDLNDILFDQFDEVAVRMLCQSQVTKRILTDARHYDVVVLVLVDGLAYRDMDGRTSPFGKQWNVEPCLVDAPTVTSVAFPNLIGDPPLASHLFDSGFHSRLGFSYWTRDDNQLTDHLFKTIMHVEKVGQIDQVLDVLHHHLQDHGESKLFAQIVRSGLDGYVHSQKRKPPVTTIIDDILAEFEAIGELLRNMANPSIIYLCSDHGILWRDEFDPQIVGQAPGKSSPRWCAWQNLYYQEDTGRRFVIEGEEYYCLNFPKLRRPLHIDEQGVHGGISYQESIVPFVTWEVVPHA